MRGIAEILRKIFDDVAMRFLVASLVLASAVVAGCHSSSSSMNHGNGADLAVRPDGTDMAVPSDRDAAMTGTGDLATSSVACISGLASLALTPANSTVTLSGGAAAPVNFAVTGTFADGHSAPIAGSALNWTATRTDATPAGMIASGALQPNATSGGTVTVTASDGCISGSTTVTFNLSTSIGTPGNPTSWGGTPTTTGTLPTIVYPSNQTRFPRNIYRTLFQWQTGGYTQFRLTFTGPFSTVVIYSDGSNPLCTTAGTGCWEADETSWSFIAGSNAGQTVTWTLDALDTSTATPTVRRAPPITIGFSKQDVTGAVFYWSTTAAGVRRANIRDAAPEDYITGKPGTAYTTPKNTVQCVACHTVSRDGKYMVAPVQSTVDKSLWVMQVTASPPPTPVLGEMPAIAGTTAGNGFATISPDDNTVVAAWNGTLWSIDRTTGNVVTANLLTGTALKGTQPDWSPDNSQLVFATGTGDAPGGASLAVVPYNNPGWGTAKVIVPANTTAKTSNLFPNFSPDGKWIAYSVGAGGHDDLNAQLYVTSSTGASPTMLVNADCVVNNQPAPASPTAYPPPAACKTENNQPTWAPPGDLYWVAFNSQRAYGVVSPAGTQQIWVAAIDPAKVGTGVDPSFPAFRLQFQGLNENNHRAFWTLDVRETQPPPDMAPSGPPVDMARQCIGSGLTCDPVNDTCCGTGFRCDTSDNGLTYTCMAPIS